MAHRAVEVQYDTVQKYIAAGKDSGSLPIGGEKQIEGLSEEGFMYRQLCSYTSLRKPSL